MSTSTPSPSGSTATAGRPPTGGSSRGRVATIVGSCVGGLALIAMIVALFVSQSSQDPAPVAQTPSSDPTPQSSSGDGAPAATTGEAPANATASGGFALGVDGVAGRPTEGAVQVDLYLDYMCPICLKFEEANAAELDRLREDGDITFVVHPVAILDRMSEGTAYSTRAASAAAAVASEAPEAFADFSAALLEQQPEEGTSGLTDAQIADIARGAGVPATVAATIEDGTATTTYSGWVTEQTAAAASDESLRSSRGFGTPTAVVDGQRFSGDWTQPGALADAVEEARG